MKMNCHQNNNSENVEHYLLHEYGTIQWCKICGALCYDSQDWILPNSLRLYKIALGTFGNLINSTGGIYFNQTELDCTTTQFKRAGVSDYEVIELTPEQVKNEILTLNREGG